MKKVFSVVISVSSAFLLSGQVEAQVLTPSVSPQQLKHLQLPDTFTLVYQMTDRDVSTSEMRDAEADSVGKGYDWMVAHGKMTPEQAQQQKTAVLPHIRQQHDPKTYTVTLSARDGKLLYKRIGHSPDDSVVLVYDGQKTFQCINRRQADLNPGLVFEQARPYPIPAIAVPYVALIKAPLFVATTNGVQEFRGNVACLDRTDGANNADVSNNEGSNNPGIFYTTGTIHLTVSAGRIKVLSAEAEENGILFTSWVFLSHKLFGQHWLASHMKWTTFQTGTAKEECEFVLQKSTPIALPESQFEYGPWLAPGTLMTIHKRPDSVTFDYNPNEGPSINVHSVG